MQFDTLFTAAPSVRSSRILYTPSAFARSSLLHLQEVGFLTAVKPHTSRREQLSSFLCFLVEEGAGELVYDGVRHPLKTGDVVFIDCRKPYSHSTSDALWSLRWCHFYGPNMNAIFHKYQERGGGPVFRTRKLSQYRQILTELYHIAGSDDYVRDMRVNEKLSALLILLMEDAWGEKRAQTKAPMAVDIQQVKDYLDGNYLQKITLDDLAARFYINKYYLLNRFKERYGVTVTAYLTQLRVTYVKQQLRFTDQTLEAISGQMGIEPAYLSRMFRKVEGIPPSEFRSRWNGK